MLLIHLWHHLIIILFYIFLCQKQVVKLTYLFLIFDSISKLIRSWYMFYIHRKKWSPLLDLALARSSVNAHGVECLMPCYGYIYMEFRLVPEAYCSSNGTLSLAWSGFLYTDWYLRIDWGTCKTSLVISIKHFVNSSLIPYAYFPPTIWAELFINKYIINGL